LISCNGLNRCSGGLRLFKGFSTVPAELVGTGVLCSTLTTKHNVFFYYGFVFIGFVLYFWEVPASGGNDLTIPGLSRNPSAKSP
jgi:hypothetical protein